MSSIVSILDQHRLFPFEIRSSSAIPLRTTSGFFRPDIKPHDLVRISGSDNDGVYMVASVDHTFADGLASSKVTVLPVPKG